MLFSLNEDFLAVFNNETFVVFAHGLTLQVVALSGLGNRCIDVLNAGNNGFCKGGVDRHRLVRHRESIGVRLGARCEFDGATTHTFGRQARRCY